MSPKVFITGATGYIGGDALYVLYKAHPNYEYSVLIRTQDKADAVKKAYPSVRVVLGDLDNSAILEEEASRADIVIHTADASDHEGAAKAIAAGLVKGHSKENPGFWLHTGGTGILTYFDSKDNFAGLGTWSEKQFNDLDGVDELTHLPDEAFHRSVDQVVLDCGIKHGDSVKTVIVCPPTIYGKGRGPVAVRSRQAYELAKLIITKGYTPIVGEGKARWNNVHVADLSDVFLLLVEKAVAKDLSSELWGEKGYMFTENGEHVWSDLARLMSKKAVELGYIEDPKEDSLSKDEALDQAGFEAVSWGLNSRGKAERARKVLGWAPHRPSIEGEAVNILKDEKARLE
ncbi:NAD(P)-binding protein [Rhizodiscina lignyota]|uniref:NAD(P)-binding protein n=1 Tax=Rhizodiscina lignyota TaxID=1504668 RepID=A0A9P4I106_9PEZI|nr:NAD(P)-binding protein [Rhizodiscina lignyota]